jgi:hypothetical protein
MAISRPTNREIEPLTGTDALSDVERDRLTACEAVIERGRAVFVEVGEALMTVRDNRLYREQYDTFEVYCQERWGMTHRHADRLIESAEVFGGLGPMGPKPTNERQARELAALKGDPDVMAEAWRAAGERTEGRPTAAVVREEVAKRRPQTQKRVDVTRQVDRALLLARQAANAANKVPEGGKPLAGRPQTTGWLSDLDRALTALNRLHDLFTKETPSNG